MQVRIDCKNENEWLQERMKHIGGSDAAKVLGMSKFGSNVDLYFEKTERKKHHVNNDAIELGKRAEPVLRDLYAVYHPSVKIDYHQYTIIYQEEYPMIASTLDGELEDDGRHGILEIKTASLTKKNQWEEWKNGIPNHYYIQVLHQMISTGYDFADVFACLTGMNGDHTIRTYRFERHDHIEDIEWVIEEETAFWKCVENKTVPPLKIY